jgi:hypothetical protein
LIFLFKVKLKLMQIITGIRNLDEIIHDYKIGLNIFTNESFLKINSFWLLFKYQEKLADISNISNLDWKTLYKIDNGNSIYFRHHRSYEKISISMFMYLFTIIGPLIAKISNPHSWMINLYICIGSSIWFGIYSIYNMYFRLDIVVIAFHEDGINFYEGYLCQSIKDLEQKIYSYEEITFKISKQKYEWTTNEGGNHPEIVRHYGFASIIFLEKTKYNPRIELKNIHKEAPECTETIHQRYIQHKTYMKNILDFPLHFIPCDQEDDNILEAVKIQPISP